MPERTITIFEEDIIVERVLDSSGIDIIDDSSNRIIEIITEGPRGPQGPQGPAGYSGAGEPFYVIISGSLYATTASLALFASISSSINPWTGSNGQTPFSLGTLGQPWKSVYVSESIFIVKSGSVLVELKGSANTLEVGQSKISTSSFGFDNPLILRISSNQQTFNIISASVSTSIDQSGRFILPNFDYTPLPTLGALFVSGSNLYIGL